MILLVTVVKLKLLPGLAVARPMDLPLEKEAVPPMVVGPMAHSEPEVAQTMDLPLVREGTQEHGP